MIKARAFLQEATARGFDFFTGVPCSFLTPLINGVLSDRKLSYVGAASEGEAVAIAAGAWLAGRRTVVMCQNSGLGNAVNPLTSLNAPFKIPTLFITTWRGEPGIADEPQHEMMGRITQDLVSLIGLEQDAFPSETAAIGPVLDRAIRHMDSTSLPFGLVMRKTDLEDEPLDQAPLPSRVPGQRTHLERGGARPVRAAVLEKLLQRVDDTTGIIATTGKCGRELFTIADRPQHLYQVGSMGCATGMGLGVALNNDRPIVALDGDGAALMKLGTFATVGAYAPKNLIHVLLDNGVHDSTGGQATVSASVDFASVALACGYSAAISADTLDGFEAALAAAQAGPKPAIIHMRIAPGSMTKLGRPTVTPVEVARRFKSFLGQTQAAAKSKQAESVA
ncbi:MAG TPA: phosphonopyruvate decarboxylase [Micropepsaceae bacterium]|jgi:phosphonopyruvate decarboxylase|nr:phosphonopyruvate decarboxylase [Micropepsaceae bacterium]